MKPQQFLLPALSAVLFLSACGEPPSTPKSPPAEPNPAMSTPVAPAVAEATSKVDADKLLQVFGSSGPEELSRVGKAAQAIRAENYGGALETLEHLRAQGHLTPEQKEIVTGIVAQLEKLKQEKR